MDRFRRPTIALVAAVTLGLAGSAATGARAQGPMSVSAVWKQPKYDFGNVIIGGLARTKLTVRLTTPKKPTTKWNPGALIPFEIVGPDKDSFRLENQSQGVQPGIGVPTAPLVDKTSISFWGGFCTAVVKAEVADCDAIVYFVPKSVGSKFANLIALDPDGLPAIALLTGEATPSCVMKVVSCNYGPLYSGNFSWNRDLSAPGSSHKENVTVTVVDGVANCSGAVTDTENGQSITSRIKGPGLFAVEFEPDRVRGQVYLITAACPTAEYEANPAQGVAALKSEPAELGHNDQNSEKQPAKEVAQRELSGAISYAAPETDPLNNVKGTVSISWTLKRK